MQCQITLPIAPGDDDALNVFNPSGYLFFQLARVTRRHQR